MLLSSRRVNQKGAPASVGRFALRAGRKDGRRAREALQDARGFLFHIRDRFRLAASVGEGVGRRGAAYKRRWMSSRIASRMRGIWRMDRGGDHPVCQPCVPDRGHPHTKVQPSPEVRHKNLCRIMIDKHALTTVFAVRNGQLNYRREARADREDSLKDAWNQESCCEKLGEAGTW